MQSVLDARVNASIDAARQNGTRFGGPASDPVVIADKLTVAQDGRSKGRTPEGAARLVGWSRATGHQFADSAATIRPIRMAPSTASALDALVPKGRMHAALQLQVNRDPSQHVTRHFGP